MSKKIILLMFLFLLSISALSADTTVGILATPEAASATLSIEKVEAELQLNGLFKSHLQISANYKIYEKDFNISEASGFFFNVGIGPSLSAEDNSVKVSAIFPVEFGYNIPELLDGKFDVYIQGKPITQIIPNLRFSFEFGLGIRYKL